MARILVVDDDPSIVDLMQVTLTRQGYEVETASNGVEALAKIRAKSPDLLIADKVMPVMDGFELMKNIRADASLQYLPVIMLTEKTRDNDYLWIHENRPDMYWTKPFNPQELLQFVKRILASSDASDGRYNV